MEKEISAGTVMGIIAGGVVALASMAIVIAAIAKKKRKSAE